MVCEWLTICLMDKNSRQTGRAASNRYAHNILSPAKTTAAIFSEPDLTTLESAGDSLQVTADSVFSTALSSMTKEGAENFILLPIRIKARLGGLLTLGFRQSPAPIDDDLIRARQIADEIAVALDNIRLIKELQSLNWGTIEALAKSVDAKSPWTAGHSERVTQLALQIGRQLELDTQQLEQLHWAGPFHDIGKIANPAPSSTNRANPQRTNTTCSKVTRKKGPTSCSPSKPTVQPLPSSPNTMSGLTAAAIRPACNRRKSASARASWPWPTYTVHCFRTAPTARAGSSTGA